MKKYLKYCKDAVPVILFVIISVAYFWNPIQGHKVLTGTDHTGAVGAGVEINEYRSQHNGETPRWTNTLFSGMPTYQLAPSYDSTNTLGTIKAWYTLGLPDVAAYVFIMLLGFYIMLRCFDFKVWMAALGAVIWAFSSYFFIIIAAGHIWKVFTLAFIPPTIGGMALCYRGRYAWGVIVTALFMGLQILSNHVQMTYYFMFVIGLMSLGWLVESIRKGDRGLGWLKSSCVFATGCILGVAMNASNLYHTWEYQKESMRGKSELTHVTKNPEDQTSSGLERSYITAWSYGIDETWTLLVPNTKGGASMPLSRSQEAMEKADNRFLQIYQQMGQYWGDQPGTSGPVYVGAFVCMLFVLCLLIVRGPMSWALLIATMLSIALSWGRNFMGFTDFFLDYVPMYDKFRTVASILVIAEFTMPLMAVMALRRFIEDPECIKVKLPFTNRKVNALWLSFGITAGICMLFYVMPDVFFGSYISQSESQMFDDAVAAGYIPSDIYSQIRSNLFEMRRTVFQADCMRSFIVIAIGTGMLLLYYFRKIKAVPMVIGITLLCLVDMWGVNTRYLNKDMFIYPTSVEQTFAKTEADELILEDQSPYYRTLDMSCSTFNSNDASYWHKSIGGYHAAKLRRYQELIEAHISPEMNRIQKNIAQTEQGMFLQGGDSIFPVLDMLNMKYVILAIQGGSKIAVQNPSAMGNAWFVDEVRNVGNADSELSMLNKVDLHKVAVSSPSASCKDAEWMSGYTSAQDSTATVTLTSYGPVELKYRANSKNGGIIVFSDIYYPGWRATVNGSEVPVGRVDYVLRAVKVPAGECEITMFFDPKTVHTTEAVAYSAMAFLALIALCILAATAWRRKKQNRLTVNS